MYGWRARIGHVIPSILDQTFEFNKLLPDGVVMVYTCLGVQDHVQEEFDRAFAKLEDATSALARERSDAIIAGGSPVLDVRGIEDTELIAHLESLTGGVPVNTTRRAAEEAMRSLGMRRIVVATPWKDEINRHTEAALARKNFEVLAIDGLQIGPTVDIAFLPEYAGYRLAREVFRRAPDADGIYIPCARFEVVSRIEALEAELHVPVVTSIQAMVWWGLRRIGFREPIEGYGRLMREVDYRVETSISGGDRAAAR